MSEGRNVHGGHFLHPKSEKFTVTAGIIAVSYHVAGTLIFLFAVDFVIIIIIIFIIVIAWSLTVASPRRGLWLSPTPQCLWRDVRVFADV